MVRETRNGGKCKKYKFNGPFVIQKKLGEWTYELVDADSGKVFRRSHNQVKRFNKPTEKGEETETGRKMEEAMANKQQPLISDCNDQLFARSETMSSASTNIPQAGRTEPVRRSSRMKKRTKRFGYDDY